MTEGQEVRRAKGRPQLGFNGGMTSEVASRTKISQARLTYKHIFRL